MAGLVIDDLSASNAVAHILSENVNSQVRESVCVSKQLIATDSALHQTEQDVTCTKVTTTVKRIQTKNGTGRDFIELQDIMRHILKVPSRYVWVY